MKYNFNKQQILNLFAQGKKISEVANELNCTVISLQRYMRKEDIKIAKRYSQDVKDKVFSLLDTGKYLHKDIAKEIGLTLSEVRSIIKYRQANNRNSIKYSNSINNDLLNNFDLFWYLIGIISTDGHISDKSNTISIFQNDYEYLKSLQENLEHKGKIYQTIGENGEPKMFTLHLLSEKLRNFLIDNKFDSDKRYSVPFLDCPKEYLNFYLRGLFDGDGCIAYRYISGRMEGQLIQFTTGSEFMKNGLKNCLENLGWKVSISEKLSQANNKYWDIKIDNREDVLAFCRYIYKGSHKFMLKRKYIKAIKLYKLLEFDKQINEIVEAI